MQECLNVDQGLKSTLDSIIEFFNHFIFIDQPESLNTILSLYKSTTGEIWHQCANQLQVTRNNSLDVMRESGAIIHFIYCLQQPGTYINETRCIIPSTYINNSDLAQLRNELGNKVTSHKETFSPLLHNLKARLDEIYVKLNNDNNVQHALILNRIANKTCDEILKDGCNILDRSISLTPLRKLWISWWTHYFS